MPEVRCTVTDPALAELSGMVVTADEAVWAMADGGRRVEIHRIDVRGLDAACEVVETRTAPIDPYDAEDLALGPDGEIWVADTGDNERDRDTVAVVVLPARGDARLHRLTYPGGPHDAEALLVDATGVPFVVTKEAGRSAGVYRTDAPPEGEAATPLRRVGELTLPVSDTQGGPIGGFGSRVVTGAGATADGEVVALRTYTDAWLYPVPDGDLTAALAGSPTRIPLPDEPQGEAVAFTGDGTLLSGSETRGGVDGQLRAVPGAAALVGGAPEVPAPAVAPGTDTPPEWLPALLGGGVAIGVLVLLGATLALRGRRRSAG